MIDIDEPLIEFNDENHSYYDVNTGEMYTSVTTLIKKYESKTDWLQVAENYARKNGQTAEYWISEWDRIKNTAASEGTAYHSMREDNWVSLASEGKMVYVNPLKEGKKRSISMSNLKDGIYSEFLAYNAHYLVCGQADELRLRVSEAYINDYKNVKRIDLESFKHWKTGHKMMTGVLSHVMDCNFYKFALQTSTYMYFLELRGYTPTKLSIEHVKDNNKKYFLPYMRDEVILMLEDHKKSK